MSKHSRILALGLVAQAIGLLGAMPAVRPLAAQGARTDASIPLDSAVRAGTLPNGLRYFVRRNSRPEKRLELRLVINAGSVLEDQDQRGLAHFVEHMLFNGTRRFKKNDIVSYLESIGVRFGADLNAYTGFDETVYILPVPTDKPGLVERGFDILEDWAAGALFDSTEVVNERGVVMEEWRLGLGADSRIRDKQFPVLFRGSRYADRLPIGDTTILKSANPAPVKRFYHDWYRPSLMAVIAVGDFEPARMEALIKERFTKLVNPASPRPRTAFNVPGHDSTLITVATDREQQVSSVQVLFKHPSAPLVRLADYRTLLVRRLYNQILNARLSEITRQPNAPFAFASSSYGPFVRTSDVYFLAAAVEDGGLQRGLEAVLREAKRVDQHGFLPAEVQRAKASLLRTFESAFAQRDQTESPSMAEEYIAYFLNNEPTPGIGWEFDMAKQLLPTVTVEEVNTLGRQWITDANRVIAVSAPDKADAKVPSEAELLSAFRKVQSETVTAYVETVSDAPLVANAPAGGSIVQESRMEEINVTDWRLSNGVRVLVKPTDYKADEVGIRGFSPGGLGLVSDEDYVNAALSSTFIPAGGLGEFDVTSLQKKLAGKRANANAKVSSLSEEISAGGSPKDLETILQLLYLRVTAPRKDVQAYNAMRAQFAPFLANRATDPDATFQDTVIVTMSSNHPRAKPLSSEMLASVNFDRAFDLYKQRFAEAGDFTFVIVGNVNVDSIRPLVSRWLGALPTQGRKEAWRDIGMKPPPGPLEKVVRKGVEPKAHTQLFFTGPATFNPANRYAMRSLGELLEMKLLETLREALGSTYTVSAGGQLSKTPREEFQFTIDYQSAPDKVDALYKAVLAVIDSVKTNGPSDADVQKVQEQQKRAQEVSLKENSYWLGNISARIENGEDPRGLLTYSDFIANLTALQIRDAARRYLDTAKIAKFVLLPEMKVVP